ncbi:MAG: protoporphyrinogen oxidase [Streptosporangiales bacterium]|nr:protoporphyrinogen oxidase [Streptosporangiales bacterium]
MPGNRSDRPRVAVVGAGVAGLTAAWELTNRVGDRVDVTVFEGAPQLGGKLRVSEVAGIPVDEGAESMLARRPEGVELVRALGAAGDLVEPATTSASIWVGDDLVPMPKGHVMGIPADVDAVAGSGLFSADTVDRVAQEPQLPGRPLTDDVAVGDYVTSRLGAEVVDRLVEPLLAGVYAGRADALSLPATLPQLAPLLRTDGSLVAAARRVVAQAPSATGPGFVSLRGGMGRLPQLLAERSGARIRTSAMVRELCESTDGWWLTVGPAREPEQVRADAVVLAVPARPASRLLAQIAPAAATELGAVEYASMALVTLVYPASAVPGRLGSGFLVPASAGRTIKAATAMSQKWPQVAADGLAVVRCSVGRYGEERTLQVADGTLVQQAVTDLAAAGIAEPPVASRVTRWGGALPQYVVGHLARVEKALAAVAEHDRLAVCGAAYGGVGVPACVASGRAAADRVLGALGHA